MRRHGVRSSKGRAANGNIIFATFPHDTATSKWSTKKREHKSERERKEAAVYSEWNTGMTLNEYFFSGAMRQFASVAYSIVSNMNATAYGI